MNSPSRRGVDARREPPRHVQLHRNDRAAVGDGYDDTRPGNLNREGVVEDSDYSGFAIERAPMVFPRRSAGTHCAHAHPLTFGETRCSRCSVAAQTSY